MKHVAIATLLSLYFPGLGQLYNNQRIKGIPLIVVQLLLGFIFLGNTTLTLLYGLIWLGGIVDALVSSLRMVKGKTERRFLSGRRAWVEVGIAFVLVTLILFYIAFTGMFLMIWMPANSEPPEPLSTVQQEAEAYLTEKYGLDFGTEEPTYNSANNTYRIRAYPQNNPDLKLTVFKVGSKPFDDTYVNSAVSKQSREELQPLIDQLYPDVWMFSCHVGVEAFLDNEVVVDGDVLDYAEIREKYPDEYAQHVDISVIRDLDEQGKQEELDRAFQVIQFFKDQGIQEVNFEVSFYAESLPEKPRKEKTRLGNYIEHLIYRISLSSHDIAEIETVADLEEHFRKRD